MSRESLFDQFGYVKLAPKVGDEPYHPTRTDPQAEIEFCTHCNESECKYGTCQKLVRMKRKMREGTKDA